MPDVPLSEVCVCGTAHWHTMVDRVIWCRLCGCVRLIFDHYWRVPLDRAGDVSSSVTQADGDGEEVTRPGTPDAKRGSGDG